MITFTGCKYDQGKCSHNQFFPILFQSMTMVSLCGLAKCSVVIIAHLNPLDQTRRTKCELAITIPSRKRVGIWFMCSRCIANAINTVLKFSIYESEKCTYLLAFFFFLQFTKKYLSCMPHLKGRQLLDVILNIFEHLFISIKD